MAHRSHRPVVGARHADQARGAIGVRADAAGDGRTAVEDYPLARPAEARRLPPRMHGGGRPAVARPQPSVFRPAVRRQVGWAAVVGLLFPGRRRRLLAQRHAPLRGRRPDHTAGAARTGRHRRQTQRDLGGLSCAAGPGLQRERKRRPDAGRRPRGHCRRTAALRLRAGVPLPAVLDHLRRDVPLVLRSATARPHRRRLHAQQTVRTYQRPRPADLRRAGAVVFAVARRRARGADGPLVVAVALAVRRRGGRNALGVDRVDGTDRPAGSGVGPGTDPVVLHAGHGHPRPAHVPLPHDPRTAAGHDGQLRAGAVAPGLGGDPHQPKTKCRTE